MKRTIIACTIMLFIGTLVASEIQFKLNGPTLRETPNGKVCTGLDFIQKYTVVDVLIPWTKVKIDTIKPEAKVAVGTVGWVYTPSLTNTNIIGGQGCSFRSEPDSKTGTVLGYLPPKTVVSIVKVPPPTWYKIDVNGTLAWVWAESVTLVK